MEARAEYALFGEQYPSSPHAPLSAYKKAISAFNIEHVPGRDNSFTQKAIRDFEAFLSNYSENVKIDSAKYFKTQLLERLAEEQLAIAVLYSRMSEPQASAIYLKEMLATYPNSNKTFDALVLLCEMYIRLDQFEQAQEFITQLQNRFPKRGQSVAVNLNQDLISAQENFKDNIENKKDKKMRKAKKVDKS